MHYWFFSEFRMVSLVFFQIIYKDNRTFIFIRMKQYLVENADIYQEIKKASENVQTFKFIIMC